MKPIIQSKERSTLRMPKIDYSYQVSSISSRGGRGYDSRRASIRAISHEYFKNEARSMFVAEAAFFGVIVMTAAVPLINSAAALVHLVRSFAAL
jgi:thymidine kinase